MIYHPLVILHLAFQYSSMIGQSMKPPHAIFSQFFVLCNRSRNLDFEGWIRLQNFWAEIFRVYEWVVVLVGGEFVGEIRIFVVVGSFRVGHWWWFVFEVMDVGFLWWIFNLNSVCCKMLHPKNRLKPINATAIISRKGHWENKRHYEFVTCETILYHTLLLIK